MNSSFEVQKLYEKKHKKSWWSLTKDEREFYYNKYFKQAMMSYYKEIGLINMQVICSATQETKFESNKYRVEHFGAYLRKNAFKCITFPYSNKSIADTTFCIEIPYVKFENFKKVLGYYEIIDYHFV